VTLSKIFESLRGYTGGGGSLSSKKLNQLFECEQSENKRVEIILLLYTL
jgi:hypothetical protein